MIDLVLMLVGLMGDDDGGPDGGGPARMAHAGDPDDCGHRPDGGLFAPRNTCASGSGGSTRAFTFQSPNVLEDTKFAHAVKALRSSEHAAAVAKSKEIDSRLGLTGRIFNAIGDWADGAENSIVTEYDGDVDPEKVKRAAALRGLAWRQKAVVSFVGDPDGPDSVHDIKVSGADPVEVRDRLDEAGIPFRSLIEEAGGTRVIVFDQGNELEPAFHRFGDHYHGRITAEIHPGRGEFIGGDTRTEADREYRKVLGPEESSGVVVGRYASQEFRHRGRSAGGRVRLARAGDPDDCGHEVAGASHAGKFAAGNTCAGEGGGDRPAAGPPPPSFEDALADMEAEWDRMGGLPPPAEPGRPESPPAASSPEPPPPPPPAADAEPPYDVMSDKALAKATRLLFGRDLEPREVAEMCGVMAAWREFPGGTVGIDAMAGKTKAQIDVTYFSRNGVTINRQVRRGADGKPYIYNDVFKLAAGVEKGTGVGVRIFSEQVDHAIRHGCSALECYAEGNLKMATEGSETGVWSGYYVWPRFGYDTSVYMDQLHGLGPDAKADLAEVLGGEPRKFMLSQLMATAEGREWWRKNGSARSMSFDLKEGSISRAVLSQYRKEKEIDDPAGPNRFRLDRSAEK